MGTIRSTVSSSLQTIESLGDITNTLLDSLKMRLAYWSIEEKEQIKRNSLLNKQRNNMSFTKDCLNIKTELKNNLLDKNYKQLYEKISKNDLENLF